jgi:hypothetical protein
VRVDGPDAVLPRALIGDVSITAEPRGGKSLFLGVARTADVERYLGDVRHATVVDLAVAPVYDVEGGSAPTSPPGQQGFWIVERSGAGQQQLTWDLTEGDWTVVVMNADGAPDVAVDVAVGATLPALGWVSAVLLSIAVAGLVVGAVVLTLAVRAAGRT